MDAKLTLKINRDVLENAKKYASDNQMSLSQLVEDYLQSLTVDETFSEFGVSPFVRSLATGSKGSNETFYKKEYQEYLLKKYQ